MAEAADFQPLATGLVCSIRIARRIGREAPARDDWNKLSPDGRAALMARFKGVCDVDRIWNQAKLRNLGDGIFEFRTTRPLLRALAFKEGRNWYVTHIDPKPGKKELRTLIEAAKRVREEHRRECGTC